MAVEIAIAGRPVVDEGEAFGRAGCGGGGEHGAGGAA